MRERIAGAALEVGADLPPHDNYDDSWVDVPLDEEESFDGGANEPLDEAYMSALDPYVLI
jgi:hypothetical protein